MTEAKSYISWENRGASLTTLNSRSLPGSLADVRPEIAQAADADYGLSESKANTETYLNTPQPCHLKNCCCKNRASSWI